MTDFSREFERICFDIEHKGRGIERGSVEWAVEVREAGRAARLHGGVLDSRILDIVGQCFDRDKCGLSRNRSTSDDLAEAEG